MSRFRLSSRAKRDLVDIRDWIGRDDPARAITYAAEITAKLGQLASHPTLGPSSGPNTAPPCTVTS